MDRKPEGCAQTCVVAVLEVCRTVREGSGRGFGAQALAQRCRRVGIASEEIRKVVVQPRVGRLEPLEKAGIEKHQVRRAYVKWLKG